MPTLIAPARWSLQRRLVLGIVVLLAVVSVVIGGASALVLRQNLLNRLDQQVVQSVGFSANDNAGSIAPPDGGGGIGPRRFGSLFLLSAGGQTAGFAIGEDGTAVQLTSAQQDALLALPTIGREAQTIDLGGSLGSYRVATRVADDGTHIIVGQSLAEV